MPMSPSEPLSLSLSPLTFTYSAIHLLLNLGFYAVRILTMRMGRSLMGDGGLGIERI